MANWVLILIVYGGGGGNAVATHPFHDKTSCELALTATQAELKQHTPSPNVLGVCVSERVVPPG